MTIGQRIAEKRKEQGLSQEALGEALGLTRQSVSKWEGDGSLPEIDKLIAMSRLFGVSVGWLLGEEEEETQGEELTEEQLRLMGEILSHYIAAQQKTASKGKHWPIWLAAAGIAAAVCLTVGVIGLSRQMERVEEQGRTLGETVSGMADDVEQMTAAEGQPLAPDGLPNIVKGENGITADFNVWRSMTGSDTVSYSAYAIPKNYEEGMGAVFVIDNGDGPLETEGKLGPGRRFEATMTCAPSDDIKMYVVFRHADGTEERQLLGEVTSFLTASFGDVLMFRHGELGGMQFFQYYDPQRVRIGKQEIFVHPQRLYEPLDGDVRELWVGLFKNRELVTWLTPISTSETTFGVEGHPDYFAGSFFFRLEETVVDIAEGDTLCCALVVAKEDKHRSGINTLTVRYGKIYDYNTIAGLDSQSVTIPLDLGYHQFFGPREWGLTEADMESAPSHKVPDSSGSVDLSTSG